MRLEQLTPPHSLGLLSWRLHTYSRQVTHAATVQPQPREKACARPPQGPVLLQVPKEKLEEVRASSRQGEQMAGRGGRESSRCCGRGA